MKTTRLHPDPADAATAPGSTPAAAPANPNTSAPAPRSPRDTVGDQALGFLSALEAQLAQLKKSAEETTLRAAELEAQQASLQEQRLQFDNDRAAMEQLLSEAQTAQTQASARAQDLEHRLAQATAQHRELEESLQSTLDQTRQQAQDQLADLARQVRDLTSAHAQSSAQADTLEQQVADLHASLHRTRDEAASITAGHAAEAVQLRTRLDEALAHTRELEQARAEALEAHTDAERLRSELREQLRASQSRISELEHTSQNANAAASEQAARIADELARTREELEQATQREQSAQHRAEELASALAREQEQVHDLRTTADGSRTALADCQQRLTDATAELASLRARVASHDAADAAGTESARENAAAIADLQSRVNTLCADLDAARTTITQLQADLSRSESSLAQARADLASARADLDAARAELDTTRADLSASRTSLADAVRQQSAASADQGEHERALTDLRDQIARAGEATADLQARVDESQRALGARDDALRVLAQRLKSAEARAADAEASANASAEASATSAPGSPRSHDEEWVELRRARLRRQRDLILAQSRKLSGAKAAIAKRREQYEEVIAQRQKIASAAAALAEERKSLQAKAGRSHAAVWVLSIVASLAVIFSMAWAVAGQVAPSVFAARAVIEADAKGGTLAKDDLLAWTANHEKLAEDPQFYNLASERFAQRAMSDMASPAAVMQRTKSDLSIMTDRAGVLTIELRGTGRERTERQLETLSLAMVALANAQRDARGDGAATIISQPARAGDEPLVDARLAYVATFGGGGLLLATVLYLVLYRLMARAKLKFEQQMAAAI
jgi:chromosome segregation ATPase